MRLMTWSQSDGFRLTKDLNDDDSIPAYAILSHTWGEDNEEVTFADIGASRGPSKQGYQKLTFCRDQARKDGYEHFWIDTCCINKDSHSELSEAITSMFKWYRNAAKCYVYLADVSNSDGYENDAIPKTFATSRWFTRGWTLQELLAPAVVEFYSQDRVFLGTKETLKQQIHKITTIPLAALQGIPLSQFSVAERIRWTERRSTKKIEDQAYCLLGIFNVFMPLIYGEGDHALRRLQRAIDDQYGANVANTLNNSAHLRSLGLCLGSAPVIQPDEFVGRAAEIHTIAEVLRPNAAMMQQMRVVLGGMGGVGKTQLAIAYAREYNDSYTSIIWLNATSESTLNISLRSVARVLIKAEQLENLDIQQIWARFQDWLVASQNNRWLLILDNYDEPDDFDIDEYCPNIGHGSVIITTRTPDEVKGHQIRLLPLQEISTSLDILQVRSRRQGVHSDNGARSLAERLGGLPLALATAGAYLRKSVITFQQYLDAYEERWQVDHRRPRQLKEYQDRTLYTTWDLSYRRLQDHDRDAAHLLQLLAYFDNQDIWFELLSAGDAHCLPSPLQLLLSDRIEFENAMVTLVDYSFLEAQVQTAPQSYRMHFCIHDWALGKLNENVNEERCCFAFDCVIASIDYDDAASQDLCQAKYSRLLPHAIRLTHPRLIRAAILSRIQEDRFGQIHAFAQLLMRQFQLSTAEQVYLQILAECERVFTPDHYFHLSIMNNLGNAYAELGMLDQAEQMYLRALAGRERSFGAEHTWTLETVHNLGVLYRKQANLGKAEMMSLRALAGRERALGPDHVLTVNTITSLGNLYREQGKLCEAELMFQRTLTGFHRVFGPNHTQTYTAMSNLGNIYRIQGNVAEAEQMFRRALAGLERVCGPDHRWTHQVLLNLGLLHLDQGNEEAAAAVCETLSIKGSAALSQAF